MSVLLCCPPPFRSRRKQINKCENISDCDRNNEDGIVRLGYIQCALYKSTFVLVSVFLCCHFLCKSGSVGLIEFVTSRLNLKKARSIVLVANTGPTSPINSATATAAIQSQLLLNSMQSSSRFIDQSRSVSPPS